MIFTDHQACRTPIPEIKTILSSTAHGTTISIYLSAAHNKKLEAALL